MITLQGQGTGLDIGGIVSSLVSAERAPKDARLNRQEANLTAEISAIGSLKSAITKFTDSLDNLKKSETFLGNKVTLPNTDYFTATADKDAVAGSYDIVVERLARSQKIGTTQVADITAPVGEGTLNFAINGKKFDLKVGADDSLQDVMEAINTADDNVGVTAAIINSQGGSTLVLTSEQTGTANNITVTAMDSGVGTGLSSTFAMSQLQSAEDAQIKIDNLTVTSQSNKVEGAITGITLDLKKAELGETTTIKIEPDKDKTKKEIQGFVKAYNGLVSTIANLSSYNAATNQSSVLQGDSTVRAIESQLRSTISKAFATESGEVRLAEFGISTTRDGKLEIDKDKLDGALDSKLPAMSAFFSTENTGFVADISAKMDVFTQTGGILDSKDQSLDRQVDRIKDDRDALNLKMQAYQKRLTKQYNAMDAAVASLNSQFSQISSRLNALSGQQ